MIYELFQSGISVGPFDFVTRKAEKVLPGIYDLSAEVMVPGGILNDSISGENILECY